MRLSPNSHVTLLILSLAITTSGSQALAQIEFANSTIRLKSSTEPAAPAPATAPQDADQPPRRLAPIRSNVSSVGNPARPVTHYAVRPAIFDAPISSGRLAQAPTPGRAPSLVGVYPGASAQATLKKMPRRPPVQLAPAAPPKRPLGKPFQSIPSEPVISPYLSLNRTDVNANNLPNYFTFVRPQLEQQEANRQQTAEIQKLRSQVQNLSSGGSGAPTPAGMTSHAHYMDTAQFYRGLMR